MRTGLSLRTKEKRGPKNDVNRKDDLRRSMKIDEAWGCHHFLANKVSLVNRTQFLGCGPVGDDEIRNVTTIYGERFSSVSLCL